MIRDMEAKKKLTPIVTELFLRGRELNISLVFISKSYSKVSETIIPNKILNKRLLQRITLSHSSDTEFRDFMQLYKDDTKEPILFLVNDTTFPSENPIRPWKDVL